MALRVGDDRRVPVGGVLLARLDLPGRRLDRGEGVFGQARELLREPLAVAVALELGGVVARHVVAAEWVEELERARTELALQRVDRLVHHADRDLRGDAAALRVGDPQVERLAAERLGLELSGLDGHAQRALLGDDAERHRPLLPAAGRGRVGDRRVDGAAEALLDFEAVDQRRAGHLHELGVEEGRAGEGDPDRAFVLRPRAPAVGQERDQLGALAGLEHAAERLEGQVRHPRDRLAPLADAQQARLARPLGVLLVPERHPRQHGAHRQGRHRAAPDPLGVGLDLRLADLRLLAARLAQHELDPPGGLAVGLAAERRRAHREARLAADLGDLGARAQRAEHLAGREEVGPARVGEGALPVPRADGERVAERLALVAGPERGDVDLELRLAVLVERRGARPGVEGIGAAGARGHRRVEPLGHRQLALGGRNAAVGHLAALPAHARVVDPGRRVEQAAVEEDLVGGARLRPAGVAARAHLRLHLAARLDGLGVGEDLEEEGRLDVLLHPRLALVRLLVELGDDAQHAGAQALGHAEGAGEGAVLADHRPRLHRRRALRDELDAHLALLRREELREEGVGLADHAAEAHLVARLVDGPVGVEEDVRRDGQRGVEVGVDDGEVLTVGDGDEQPRLGHLDARLALLVGRPVQRLAARQADGDLGALLRLLIHPGDAHEQQAVGLLGLHGQIAHDEHDLALDAPLHDLQHVEAGRQRLERDAPLLEAAAVEPSVEAGDGEFALRAAEVEVEPLAAHQLHALGQADQLLGAGRDPRDAARGRLRSLGQRRGDLLAQAGVHREEEEWPGAAQGVEPAGERVAGVGLRRRSLVGTPQVRLRLDEGVGVGRPQHAQLDRAAVLEGDLDDRLLAARVAAGDGDVERLGRGGPGDGEDGQGGARRDELPSTATRRRVRGGPRLPFTPSLSRGLASSGYARSDRD